MAESSKPRSGMDLPTDITDIIADMLLEQKSLTYDELDISRDAAKCMLVGNPAFTSIGQTLYKAISPRLGQTTEGLTEKSPAPQMKALLKTWKLPLGGTKPQLWQRIQDQVSVPEDCNDQLCPCSAATRDMVKGLGQAMVSQSKAKDVFGLTKYNLESSKIPCEVHIGSGFGISYHYPLKDIKAACIRLFGGWKEVQRSKQRIRDAMDSFRQQSLDLKQVLKEHLEARGVDMGENSLGARTASRMWYLDANPRSPEAVGRLCDKVQAHIWFATECTEVYTLHRIHAFTSYLPKKQSQYKMDNDREEYAKVRALEDWARGQTGSLDTVLRDPKLPGCMHDSVRAVWRKLGRAT